MNLKGVSSTVKNLLEADALARDNDQWLIARIWAIEIKSRGLSTKEMTASQFLKMFATESVLSSPESIRRSRQKLQEQNPNLRGKAYEERHTSAEPQVRQQIIDWQ